MIEAEKAGYPIKRMCALLEVSRSGFYKWRANRDAGPTPSQRRRAELDAKVATSHTDSDGVYGTPRILADYAPPGTLGQQRFVHAPQVWVGVGGRSKGLAHPAGAHGVATAPSR